MPSERRRYPGPTAQAAVSATRTSAVMVRMSVALCRSRRDLRRGRGLGSASQQAPLAQRADHREEQRDEEDPHGGRDEHPEEHARADRVAARRSGAARREERRDAENERERGHQDRPQPLAARLERRLPDGAPLGTQLVRELDDQDRVLRGEANYDNEADLHIYVVRHADRKSTRLNSSHSQISYAVFCLKKKK